MGAQADVTHLDQLQAVVDQAIASYGRLGIMVNNAGLKPARLSWTPPGGLRQGSRCEPQECLWYAVRRQTDDQTRRWRPSSISLRCMRTGPCQTTPPIASKGGVRMLTRTAGVELAPHGITLVNMGLAPLIRRSMPPMPPTRRCSTNWMRRFPLGAWLSPRKSPLWLPLWLAMEPATSPPPASLPMAASCNQVWPLGLQTWPGAARQNGSRPADRALAAVPPPPALWFPIALRVWWFARGRGREDNPNTDVSPLKASSDSSVWLRVPIRRPPTAPVVAIAESAGSAGSHPGEPTDRHCFHHQWPSTEAGSMSWIDGKPSTRGLVGGPVLAGRLGEKPLLLFALKPQSGDTACIADFRSPHCTAFQYGR